MVQKVVLVLANSVKNKDRCVAGREVLPNGEAFRLGPWVRPISNHGEGELNWAETQLKNGHQIRVLNLVEMTLECPVGDPFQPENWRFSGPGTWKDVSEHYPRPRNEMLEEHPSDLWLQKGARSDRTAHACLQARPPRQSLYVIRPEKLRISLHTEGEKKRQRAVFAYRGIEYNLAMTDPEISRRYCSRFPGPGEKPLLIPFKGDVVMCVSLAAEFLDHYHYKVVATIFEGNP